MGKSNRFSTSGVTVGRPQSRYICQMATLRSARWLFLAAKLGKSSFSATSSEGLWAVEHVSFLMRRVLLRTESHKEGHYMGRRRGLKRRRKGRKSGRDAQPERFGDVRVERNPKGRRKKSAKVTKIRRRNGKIAEESYEV